MDPMASVNTKVNRNGLFNLSRFIFIYLFIIYIYKILFYKIDTLIFYNALKGIEIFKYFQFIKFLI